MVSFTQPGSVLEEKSSSSFLRGSIHKIEKNLIDFVMDQIRT